MDAKILWSMVLIVGIPQKVPLLLGNPHTYHKNRKEKLPPIRVSGLVFRVSGSGAVTGIVRVIPPQ